MSDRRYQIECENSYDMVDVRRLIDDVMFQLTKPDGEINPQVTPLQNKLEKQREELLKHRLKDSNQKEVFISYTWRDEQSKLLVKKIEQAFQAKGIKIIRDTNAIGYKKNLKNSYSV